MNTVADTLVLPLTKNNSGKVLIQTVSTSESYKYTSYIITSVNGESIVLDPTSMPSKDIIDINPVVIISTHDHPDHVDKEYSDSYECQKLIVTNGEINTRDFHIVSIPSDHFGDTITDPPTNHIIIMEVDGLRIAHLGDIGQTSLTKDQLEKLGNVDIAFTQFVNWYSDMSYENEKGFKVIEQLNPKVIIPTHYDESNISIFEERYKAVTDFDNILKVSKEDIPAESLKIYRILNTHKYN